jgi:hypothetical protein
MSARVCLIETKVIGTKNVVTIHETYTEVEYDKPPFHVSKEISKIINERSLSLLISAKVLGISVTEMSNLRLGRRYYLSDEDLKLAVKLLSETSLCRSRQ